MNIALAPLLISVFDRLFVASIVFGFGCFFYAAYGAMLLGSAQPSLLRALQEFAPLVYQRLHDPLWRGHINPWNMAAFLKSDELDDVPTVQRVKEKCRHAWRWQNRGLLGFLGAWVLGFVIGTIAVALGSTSIRSGL